MTEPIQMIRPVYRFYQWVWTGLDWLFPPQCGGCGRDGSRWCSDCQKNTQILPLSVCQVCGRVMQTAALCQTCRNIKPPYTALRSWALYTGPLRSAIHRLKYEGDISLGDILARPMLSLLQNTQWIVDMIVPVPIGSSRKTGRGYNQAALLALPLALGLGIAYRNRVLNRTRDTRSQVGLTVIERRANVAGAFRAVQGYVEGKNVLVVDDVMTSGATIEACAKALIEAGANKVYGVTLAQAMYNSKSEELEIEKSNTAL